MIHQVPTAYILDLWSAIEGHVKTACADLPFVDADDIRSILLAGSGQLFISVDNAKVTGFAVMDMLYFPRRKVANVFVSGGDNGFLSTAIHDLLPELKKWGAQQGADAFAISGRPGWMRALRDHGFRTFSYVTLVSDIDGEHFQRGQQQEPNADDDLRAVEGRTALSH